jgi:hypothetical protein
MGGSACYDTTGLIGLDFESNLLVKFPVQLTAELAILRVNVSGFPEADILLLHVFLNSDGIESEFNCLQCPRSSEELHWTVVALANPGVNKFLHSLITLTFKTRGFFLLSI